MSVIPYLYGNYVPLRSPSIRKEMNAMVTMETIKKDLHEIRYYYQRKEQFDKAFETIGACSPIIEKAERYHRAICEAPPRLFEMYHHLFVDFRTYEQTAEELHYSKSYIYKMCKGLYEFFLAYFSEERA